MKRKGELDPNLLDKMDIDSMADEIVENILSSIDKENISQNLPKNTRRKGVKNVTKDKKIKKSNQNSRKGVPKQMGNDEIEKLTRRIGALENRTEKYISSFRTSAVESSRFTIEKAEEARNENEQMILDLQRQMEDLRTAMIRLSNRIKSITGEKPIRDLKQI